MENSNISTCKNYNLQKHPRKRNQNASRYYNSKITNLKFQHKPKYHLSKILVLLKKIDLLLLLLLLLLLPRGQNPLSYSTLE